jgi:catalase
MARKHLTIHHVVPVADIQRSLTSGQSGPVLLWDVHLIEKQEMMV